MNNGNTREFPLIKDGANAGKISVSLERLDKCCILRCNSEFLEEMSYEATDFFKALVKLRDDLSKVSLMPAVYGAHIDVFPGGLAGESSDGLLAYYFSSSKDKKLVDIFDILPTSELDKLSSYGDQRLRRKSVIQGLGKRV